MDNLSDEQLIAKYLAGEEAALNILVGRYAGFAYGMALRYVKDAAQAEDVVQEAFIKVWKNLHKFKADKKFKAWLAVIVKNTALDWCRKRQIAPLSEVENVLTDKTFSLEENLDNKILGEQISIARKILVPKYNLIFSLRHDRDFSFNQIAAALGEPLNTVKSRYHRAVIRLRKALGNN